MGLEAHDTRWGMIHIRLGDGVEELESVFNSLRAKNAAAITPITYDPLGSNRFMIEDFDRVRESHLEPRMY